ncbi:chitin synthase D [Talaromyces proteolyticus]|uniref:chitin synthase n=1 Tax=Talaromyces proteolyticus TaxID=1131652 RepID=A0AAD4KQS7_9EURO|nr:chitin synthase D [Talaromyces proteolyticus]KAH8698390.1 chitin synthase D [Talaromyces proteolyticus]
MDDSEDGVVAMAPGWSVADIVYVSLLAPLILAAFLEWFLWLGAFLFGLCKVYAKAEHWSSRVIAVVMMILFTLLRGVFLPVMLFTLPLPSIITQYFPSKLVKDLQWFAFYTFAVLLLLPLVTNEVGRSKRIKTALNAATAPKVVVVMPVYNEEPEVLIKAIDSVVRSDYPPSCIHVFVSFDGEPAGHLWDPIAERLGIPIGARKKAQSIDVLYEGVRITVSRFSHGGKRNCQKKTFKLIDKIYTDYVSQHDDLFILFIDSDCILDEACIQNFMYDMELKPGSQHDMLAMTGIITSTTRTNSLITLLQDMEYIHGQLFERSVESCCGAVTCLPGALTMLRFSAFRKMAKYYFEDQIDKIDDFFDYLKCHLGEDRWLTHLFMVGTVRRYQIQLCTGAFCKTEAAQTMRSLIKQRRRWFLGFISNEVCMLTDVRIWKRYPLLCIIRFMQDTIRTTALLFFIMVLSVSTTANKISSLPVGFIAVSLGLNYALMLYFGYILRRFKAWLYPLMFLLNPFFNWLYLVYGCCTAGKRTWGGPRTDATKADEYTSPREAAEQAEAQGDDLNVDVSTFREYGNAAESVPLHPTESIESRLADSYQKPYNNANDSEMALMRHNRGVLSMPGIPLHPRNSFDSTMTGQYSINLPRRVESLMDEVEQRKLHILRESKPSQNEAPSPPPVDRLGWNPQATPSLTGIPYIDGAMDAKLPAAANTDPLKQPSPLHLSTNQNDLRNEPTEDGSQGDASSSLTSNPDKAAEKPRRKLRGFMSFGRRHSGQE